MCTVDSREGRAMGKWEMVADIHKMVPTCLARLTITLFYLACIQNTLRGELA